MSANPIILGRPNLAPRAFPEVERYPDPIEAGYANSLIRFDIDSFACNKMHLKNKKLDPMQKRDSLSLLRKLVNIHGNNQSIVQTQLDTDGYLQAIYIM